MKEIKDMNLAECLGELRVITIKTRGTRQIADRSYQLADRIHELTRWHPVSERMPTEEDADQFGHVRMWWRDKPYGETEQHYTNLNPDFFSHWQRITPPEDK